ncbi:MAG: TetR/AcrR family transcriptional regulator, partial [Chloroflexota bacterium]
PTTARGRARVNKILDAAADLLVEVGYADLTTNAIAEQAETSIGSLYQYFRNKDAVLEALASRYLDELNNLLDVFFGVTEKSTLSDDMISFVEGARHFFDKHPAFEPLFFGAVRTPGLAEIASHTYQHLVGRVDAVMAAYMPNVPQSQRHAYAQTLVSLVKLQLPSLRSVPDDADRERLYREILAMARAYLETMPTDAAATSQAPSG